MNDNTARSFVADGDGGWQELTAEAADALIATLAEAARRHRVMVSITITPYESDLDDE